MKLGDKHIKNSTYRYFIFFIWPLFLYVNGHVLLSTIDRVTGLAISNRKDIEIVSHI